MRFKLSTYAVLLLALVVGSCSDKLPNRSIVDLKEGELGCLDGFSAKVESYFRGELSKEEIEQVFTCGSESIDKFLIYVGGAQPGVYRPAEVVEFIETYFLRDTKISEALLEEVMELKKVLFGGTDDLLSESDLRNVQRLLHMLKNEMVRLQPYMPFSISRLQEMSVSEKNDVLARFRESAEAMGTFFEETVGSYRFERFERFVNELEVIFEDGGGIEGLRWVRDNLYLFRVAKVFANYTPGSMILREEWRRLFQIGARWALVGLEASFLTAHYDGFYSDDAMDALDSILGEVVSLLEDAIRLRPGKLLSFDEISILLRDSFRDGRVTFPGDYIVETDVLLRSIRAAVQQFLGGPGGNLIPWLDHRNNISELDALRLADCRLPPEQAGRCINGLSLPSLRFLRSRIRIFADSQHLINRVYMDLGADPDDPDPKYLKNEVIHAILSHAPEEVGEDVIENVLGSIVPFQPLYRSRSFALTTSRFPVEPPLSKWQVSNFSWMRIAVRLFIGGYAEEQRGQQMSAIQVQEFRKFYAHFRDLGIRIKVFDPRFEDSPESRTREANLFTSNANGNGVIELNEGVEELAYLFSLKKFANRMHDDISRVCPIMGMDLLGFPMIEWRCYRTQYLARIERELEVFPDLQAYFHALSQGERREFLATLEKAARRDSADPSHLERPFEVDDTESMSAIIHYMESLIHRFDQRTPDGGIDEAEARDVFQVVRSEIRAISPIEEDAGNFAILTYLMKYGTRPSTVQYLAWRAREVPPLSWVSPWDVWAGRGNILSVFAELGTSSPR